MDEMKYSASAIPNENYIPLPRETKQEVSAGARRDLQRVRRQSDRSRRSAGRIGQLEFEVTKAGVSARFRRPADGAGAAAARPAGDS